MQGTNTGVCAYLTGGDGDYINVDDIPPDPSEDAESSDSGNKKNTLIGRVKVVGLRIAHRLCPC